MDGGAWWATVHGVAKSRTWLSDFNFTFTFTFQATMANQITGLGKKDEDNILPPLSE